MTDAIPVAHHQLLAHGLAVNGSAIRGRAEGDDRQQLHPGLARERRPGGHRRPPQDYDTLHNRLFTDPILLGAYPDLSAYGSGPDLHGAVRDGDLDLIAAPLDGLGINYYNPTRVAAPGPEHGLPFQDVPIEGVPRSAFDWPVVPDGLRELLVGLAARYGAALPPIYITENGTSVDDEVVDGRVADADRIDFLDGHIRALAEAMAAGRRRARLPDLDADGQLRVGRGVPPALRARARRPSDADAHAEGLLLLAAGSAG